MGMVLMWLSATFFADSDVVTLNNGERVIGVVQQFDCGLLVVSPGPAGKVEIEWNAVATITSSQPFQIEVSSGGRYLGNIEPCFPGSVRLQTRSRPITLEMKNIVRMYPIRTGVRARTIGSLKLGFGAIFVPAFAAW